MDGLNGNISCIIQELLILEYIDRKRRDTMVCELHFLCPLYELNSDTSCVHVYKIVS